MSTVILVPRRADHGHRDRLWAFASQRWTEFGFDIYEGDHTEGAFNRSAAINTASKLAGDWDTAIIIDSDVLVDFKAVKDAMVLAEEMQRVVFPFRVRHHLNSGMTKLIMGGHQGSWKSGITISFWENVSSCFVIPRAVWDRVGGFDERFVGWGWEDTAFNIATGTLAGNALRLQTELWHLWHPKSPENNGQSPLYLANTSLAYRYMERRHDVEQMEALLSEDGGPLS